MLPFCLIGTISCIITTTESEFHVMRILKCFALPFLAHSFPNKPSQYIGYCPKKSSHSATQQYFSSYVVELMSYEYRNKEYSSGRVFISIMGLRLYDNMQLLDNFLVYFNSLCV